MSVTIYNGSALIAMVGKDCFAIASDRRLGVNFQTIATNFQRIFKIEGSKFSCSINNCNSVTSCISCAREKRDMRPETFASLVSAILYEKRFGPYFCEPIIAGLGEDGTPFICTTDLIGAKTPDQVITKTLKGRMD